MFNLKLEIKVQGLSYRWGKKKKNHLNVRILVTLQNLIFSKILPNHSQMAESDSQVVSIFNQRKERQGMPRMQRGVDVQKSQGIHAECTL